MTNHKHTRSVRFRFIALLLLCWLIPLVLIVGVNMDYLTGDKLEAKFSKELERVAYSGESSLRRLESAVDLSLEASYQGELVRDYRDYRAGRMTERELLTKASSYLRDQYSWDERVKAAILWYRSDPERLYANVYNTREGATFNQIRTYWLEDYQAVDAIAAELGTGVAFYYSGNRLYLVRNLCTPEYEPAATLVFLLNQEYCFSSYTNLPAETAISLQLDDCSFSLVGEPVTAEETGMERLGGSAGYRWRDGVLRLYHQIRSDRHCLTTLVRYEDNTSFTPVRAVSLFVLLMLLCLIPLVVTALTLFHRHVNTPVRKLLRGAHEIAAGELGYQLDYEPTSREFAYLTDSFNGMSQRLEYQFKHIYQGELALRDARIKALQAHINPHFMNNTLEIINWEARLAGNDKVSEMIEALATLMNAGIDRKGKPEIPLSEELVYVQAYLYIISQRMGDRLTILNELPDDIMDCTVPRLILQPVIENAIEHGVVRTGKGTVLLYGYWDGDFLCLEIMNDGVITEEDRKKLDRLLDTEYDSTREPAASLGIANVNQRLRILYGPDSGLTVEQADPSHICARLRICQNGPKIPQSGQK